MRKIVVMMSVSVDGFISGPGGDLSWHRVDEEVHSHFNEQLGAMSAFLYGRRMYELMDDFWPTADEDPASPEPMVEYARIYRDTPKIVYSTTLQAVGPNATLMQDVVAADVRRLKDQPGGNLALGGADIAAEFARHGLVDEYRIYVHPVVVAAGTPLFRASERPTDLRLLDTRRFGNGVVLLHYAVETESVKDGELA
jgi:dihydrofolate reductase